MPSQSGFAVRLLFFQVCRVGGEQIPADRIDSVAGYHGVRIGGTKSFGIIQSRIHIGFCVGYILAVESVTENFSFGLIDDNCFLRIRIDIPGIRQGRVPVFRSGSGISPGYRKRGFQA